MSKMRFRDISINKKLFYIMAIMAVLITTELVVLTYTIKILSAVRSYVGGEGLWSKAQKNASYYLIKYSYTHNEKDYQLFQYYLQVPLSDHKSRIALGLVPIDYKVARQGFLGGRIHSEDIDGVIWLFTTFNRVDYIHRAIILWTEADELMGNFVQLGSQLHDLISSNHATPAIIAEQLTHIDKLNDQLTTKEDEFSYTLGQASRWLESIIFKLIIFTAITVEFTGIFLTILTGLQISRSINSMNRIARKITSGDFSERVTVYSKDEIGQLAGLLNAMIDELEKNFKHTKQLEYKFKSLLEGAPDAMIITDSIGQIVMINARAENIFGYSKSEIIGKSVDVLIPERSRKYFDSKNIKTLYHKDNMLGSEGQEIYGLRKNGLEFPVEISFSPVDTDEGVLVLVAIRDVTAKKEIEDLLVYKNVELVNSDLAKDQFMSHVSHELRTPLNGIVSMTQLLLTSNLTPAQRENLNIINESNEQLLLVINQILDFSKVESGNIGVEQIKIELEEFVSKIVATYIIKSSGKGLKFIFHVDPDTPKVFIGDLVKIRQILINLLDNAVKFTDQGSINFHVYSRPKDSLTTNIIFEVSDTGIGIAADIIPKIFKPFSQGDSSMTRKYGGTGLGLAISKKLATAMNGSINVESSPGSTKFTLKVPSIINSVLSNGDVLPDKQESQTFNEELSSGRILLIEDNRLNQRTITILMQELGYTVMIANDGLEGLKLLSSSDYNLVLMDCQMPNLDGFQTTIEIRKRENGTSKHIPIIGLTAHAMESHRKECLDSGMDGYLSKPFNIYDLHRLVKAYILKVPYRLSMRENNNQSE